MLIYAGLFALLMAGELGLLDNRTAAADDSDDLPPPEDDTGSSEFDDTAEDDRDTLEAGEYSAELRGTEDSDALTAGSARDLAWYLGDGDDALDASDGADFADGGAGDDSLYMRAGSDIALGGAGNDRIDAGVGDDRVSGEAGDDRLTGNGGDDTLFGGAGNDTATGGSGNDLVAGNDGNDVLSGLAADTANTNLGEFDGIDTLLGGAGDDLLLMGAQDVGLGGEGADTFRLDDTNPDLTGPAQVLDFDPDQDMLELLYTPQLDAAGQPMVPQIEIAGNGQGSWTLTVDGDAVAQITSATAQALTLDMIRLIPA